MITEIVNHGSSAVALINKEESVEFLKLIVEQACLVKSQSIKLNGQPILVSFIDFITVFRTCYTAISVSFLLEGIN